MERFPLPEGFLFSGLLWQLTAKVAPLLTGHSIFILHGLVTTCLYFSGCCNTLSCLLLLEMTPEVNPFKTIMYIFRDVQTRYFSLPRIKVTLHGWFVTDVLEDNTSFQDRHVHIFCVYRYVPPLSIFLNSFFSTVCVFRLPPIFCWIISSKSSKK